MSRPRELDDADRRSRPVLQLYTTPPQLHAPRAVPTADGPPMWAMVAMVGFAIYGVVAWSVGSVIIVLELVRIVRL